MTMLPKQLESEANFNERCFLGYPAPDNYPGLEPGKLYRIYQYRPPEEKIAWTIEVWRSTETQMTNANWGLEPVGALTHGDTVLYRSSVDHYHEIITPEGILGFILVTSQYRLIPEQ